MSAVMGGDLSERQGEGMAWGTPPTDARPPCPAPPPPIMHTHTHMRGVAWRGCMYVRNGQRLVVLDPPGFPQAHGDEPEGGGRQFAMRQVLQPRRLPEMAHHGPPRGRVVLDLHHLSWRHAAQHTTKVRVTRLPRRCPRSILPHRPEKRLWKTRLTTTTRPHTLATQCPLPLLCVWWRCETSEQKASRELPDARTRTNPRPKSTGGPHGHPIGGHWGRGKGGQPQKQAPPPDLTRGGIPTRPQ